MRKVLSLLTACLIVHSCYNPGNDKVFTSRDTPPDHRYRLRTDTEKVHKNGQLAVYLISEPPKSVCTAKILHHDPNGLWRFDIPPADQHSYSQDDTVRLRIKIKKYCSEIDIISAKQQYYDTTGTILLPGFVANVNSGPHDE